METEAENGSESVPISETLVLNQLLQPHPGYPLSLHNSYSESARVYLEKFHISPTNIVIEVYDKTHRDNLVWEAPDQQIRNSQANLPDAACFGAYAISILCVERKLRRVVVSRAEALTGADWYIAPPGLGVDEFGAPDLDCDAVLRLEVSGVGRGSIEARVTKKKKQLKAGQSVIPGIAAVVGFEKPIVRITLQD